MRTFQTLVLALWAASGFAAGEANNTPADEPAGFVWESALPENCPFAKSTSLTGIFFTGLCLHEVQLLTPAINVK
jgi:hypothetical protein